ncbi:hypothetical protein RB195_007017 [Necator americanus]|uniref:CUE domain-containing protein n=1 Tax=Necator americanus TaxID=51031 RepID=A0ABR1BY45_NECAM
MLRHVAPSPPPPPPPPPPPLSYSPDIAPSDYQLFELFKAFVAKKIFTKFEEVKQAISDFFDSQSPQFWEKGIADLHISADECVAWAHVMLPQAIFSGETIDDYYSLSGQQGEGKEGMIHLIISFAPVDATLSAAAILPSTASPPLPVEITAEDTKELEVMFPGVDREVIRCVLEESRGDKDATVSVLLEMSRNE